MSNAIAIAPNLQNDFYRPEELPQGWLDDTQSMSGGRLAWGNGPTPTAADIIAMGPSEAYRKIRFHSQDPAAYVHKTVIADIEHPENPGIQRDASPEFIEQLSDAYDIRMIAAHRHFPPSTRFLAWCSGNALQETPVPVDYRDMWGLLSMAKHGAFRLVDGFVMRVYPTAGSDTIPRRFQKVGNAIDSAVQMGRALVEEAGCVDGRCRTIFIQGSFEQFGDDRRPGRDSLPARDIADMALWSQDAGADRFGIWSAGRTLADGRRTPTVMGEVDEILRAAGWTPPAAPDLTSDEQAVD